MNAPKLTDFTCTTCGAQMGEPCRSGLASKRKTGHARRADKLARALVNWQNEVRP